MRLHTFCLYGLLFAMFGLAACGDPAASSSPALNSDDAAYVDSMAAEHADDSAAPSGAPAADSEGLVTARVAYHDGHTGYVAYPEAAAADLPGLLVIHEWWGLNDNVLGQARRLARAGYRVLAVDLYEGQAAETPDGARALMTEAMSHPDSVVANLASAADYLRAQGAPRLGVLGWCFGGAWSLRTALALPDEIDAAVIYYGRVETDATALAALDMPILGLFGADDQGIPAESARAFDAALDEVGVPHTIRIFDGADHAFANPSGDRYQAEAAEEAWSMTTAFLAEHLGASP
ncbi:MAG: dienelactone hydrolase family protein [Bacteroidota bacterium]